MGSTDSPRLPAASKFNLALLAALACLLAYHLWPEWEMDPDLSHGFLVPAACVLLIFLAKRTDAVGSLKGPAPAALVGLYGAIAIAVLLVAGLLAASLDWESPVVDFALASAFALLGVAALAAFSDEGNPWVPFRWPALAAAFIWPLASPLPPGTYSRLTLGLQLRVSSGVVHTLDALGIAAHRDGNVIELAHGTVGIEEACSGVRSLIACVFAGILFSAALTRRPWARIALVALSAPLALGMNFIRSLLLTLLVNAGVEVEGTWHDVTGYGVLVVTAALLAGVAILLDRSPPPADAPQASQPRPAAGTPASQKVLTGVLAAIVAVVAFFAGNTLSPVKPKGPAPDVLALLPSEAPGWEVVTRTDLDLFAGTLRTDHMAERTYVRNSASGGVQTTIYVAYWPAGQASVGLVGTHTPDACWPGTGWVASAVDDPRVSLPVGSGTLPPAQHRLFVNKGYPQNVWFWQIYDGHPVEIGGTRSVASLVGIALRFGFRQGGDQMFIRVSSNRPWEEISHEPFVASFLERVRPLGLY